MLAQPYSPGYFWVNRPGEPDYNHQRFSGWDDYFRYRGCSFDEDEMVELVWNEMKDRLMSMPLVEWSRLNVNRPTDITATRRYLAGVVEDPVHRNTSSKKLMLVTNQSEIDGNTCSPREQPLSFSWFRAARVWQPLCYCFRMSNEWYMLEIARSRRFWQAVHNRSIPTTLYSGEDQHHACFDGPVPASELERRAG